MRLDPADIDYPIRLLKEAIRATHAAPYVIRRRSSVWLPGRLLRAFVGGDCTHRDLFIRDRPRKWL